MGRVSMLRSRSRGALRSGLRGLTGLEGLEEQAGRFLVDLERLEEQVGQAKAGPRAGKARGASPLFKAMCTERGGDMLPRT